MSRLSLAVFVVIELLSLTTECICANVPFRPTISVTGTSVIRVAPDEIVLSISVESRMKELEKAFEDNDEKIRNVISLLKISGVASNHIRTEVINISPIFADRKHGRKLTMQQANADPFGEAETESLLELIVPVPVGYLAKRGLSVRIMQLDEFEKIYRELIKKGVNRVEGISFQTSKLRKVRDQARLKAVEAAHEKAVAMATELGARVAAVDQVMEEGSQKFSRTQNYLRSEGGYGGEQSESIAAGMMEVRASVRVVFLLDEVEFDN